MSNQQLPKGLAAQEEIAKAKQNGPCFGRMMRIYLWIHPLEEYKMDPIHEKDAINERHDHFPTGFQTDQHNPTDDEQKQKQTDIKRHSGVEDENSKKHDLGLASQMIMKVRPNMTLMTNCFMIDSAVRYTTV